MTDPSTDILKRLSKACDPLAAATDAQYIDCSDARGEESFAVRFQRKLQRADRPLCVLFTGHLGGGKSSELRRLERDLDRPAVPGERRYLPVFVDAEDYLGRFDIGAPELLLATVTSLGDALRSIGIPDPTPNVFQRLFGGVTGFLGEISIDQASVGAGWGWANISVGLRRLKKDPNMRMQVRTALLPHASTQLDEIRTLFEERRAALRKANAAEPARRYNDFVLIVDNLEKLERIGREDQRDAQRELFIDSSSLLLGLDAHVVYTVPLDLVRSEVGPLLGNLYGSQPFVLPMIKILERDGATPYNHGRERMREILASRLIGTPLDNAIEPDTLDYMVTYSGGHVRSLMFYVQAATDYTETAPLRISAAKRAVGQTAGLYSTSIHDSHWVKLLTLERSTDRKIAPEDADFIAMLRNLSVLEYINGDQSMGEFAASEPWYAVNPVVKELTKYKSAEAAAGGV